MKKLMFAFAAFPMMALAAAYMDVTTDKDPVTYAVNEMATLTFAVKDTATAYDFTWTAQGDDGVKMEGEGANVQVTCSKPGFVRVVAKSNPSGYSYTASVGFGVANITPDSTRPADLRGFWSDRLNAITAAIDASKVEMTYSADVGSCKVYKVRLNDLPDGLGPCTGWLSIPKGADDGNKYPADGLFFGYDTSWSSVALDRPTSVPSDKIQFRVMAHAFELEQDAAYYTEFKAGTTSRGKTHGLDPVQNEHPETSYFNGMACRDIRAMLFLKTLSAWNGTDLTTTGHSQGGLQSVWAGMTPGVTQINPECPWNCNIFGPKAGRVNESKVPITWVAGLDYYDPCFVGKLLDPDCFVNITRAGLADYTCPPSGLAAFYNSLPQKKAIAWVQGSGHSNYPAVWEKIEKSADAVAFDPATDDPDTKVYVKYVPSEDTKEDGWCGDISAYTDLTNRFVSKGGTWGANDQKYKLIQDAVSAAKAGDVIWVHDGFVCKPESADDYVGSDSGNSSKAHFKIDKSITLRSVSGDARGHENPPVLQGRFHDEEGAKTNPCYDTWIGPEKGGTLAIRALAATAGTYKGLVFEHSANGGWHPSYAECAIMGSGYTIDKCVIRDCHGETSLLNAGITMTDCVVSNNVIMAKNSTLEKVAISGGGKLTVRGTLFANNKCTPISLSATADVGSTVSNCVFRGNAGRTGGIESKGPVLVQDCLFDGNEAYERGGAFCGAGMLTNCVVINNYTYHNRGNYAGQGGGVCGVIAEKDPPGVCTLCDCVITNNQTRYVSSGGGGGVERVIAYRCLIADNVAQGNGGGANESLLYDCQVLDNEAKNVSSTNGGRGGGIYNGSATRCVIAGNVATNLNNTANCGRGGGSYDASLYNCVVSNNYSYSAYSTSGGSVFLLTSGRTMVNTLVAENKSPYCGTAGVVGKPGTTVVNCTIAGNISKNGNRGCVDVSALNTIVWNNTGNAASTYLAATNSCIDITVTDAYPDCISTDPQFAGTGSTPYALKDTDSPCVDTALAQAWMLEIGNPCAKALNDIDRIMGVKPDMGCYELYQEGVSTHTVTFDLGEHGTRTGGGDLIQVIQHKEAAVAPTVQAEVLWKFENWDKDFSSVTADMTVNAVYSEVDPETVYHTVTFVLGNHLTRTGGGELVQTVTHFHSAVEPEVTADEGWEHVGWNKEFSSVESDLTVNAIQQRVEILPPEGPAYDDPDVDITQYSGSTNRFVSSSGEWGGNDQKYTSLGDAVAAAKAGDVIWLRNGYVERPADVNDYISSGNTKAHLMIEKNVTVRSVKGDARNHPNPPRLRGRFHDPNGETIIQIGDNAIRPLWATAGRYLGLVVEQGAHNLQYGYCEAAIYGSGYRLEKCVVRDCYSTSSVLNGNNPISDCVISNCNSGVSAGGKATILNTLFAFNTGLSVYLGATTDQGSVISNSVFTGNVVARGQKQSGGIYSAGPVLVASCQFVNNFDYERGGAYCGQGTLTNCLFTGNHTDRVLGSSYSGEGGAVCGESPETCVLYDCIVTNNWTEHAGGASGAGVYKVTAYRTLIADNTATGDGGGAYESNLYDCDVFRNESRNISSNQGGHGGGVSKGRAVRCRFVGNRVLEKVHPTPCDGAAAFNADLVNCVISNNVSNSGYDDAGGAVCFTESGHELVNCLVVSNASIASGVGGVVCPDNRMNLMVNCTVADNVSKSGIGGSRGVVAVNSISWSNEGNADTFVAATNSCASILTDTTTYPGCVSTDPKFISSGATPYGIRMHSPCKNAGLAFGWMTDPTDLRSKDLAGNDRLIGPKPDMGCYERKPVGLTLIVR